MDASVASALPVCKNVIRLGVPKVKVKGKRTWRLIG